jgi:hypothetical protein
MGSVSGGEECSSSSAAAPQHFINAFRAYFLYTMTRCFELIGTKMLNQLKNFWNDC